jgi:N-acetylneuraminate synthase/N,N'-diacetyllegionaminate synthase
MSSEERSKTMFMRRSIFAGQDLAAGQRLTEELLDYRRPGHGISPSQVEKVLGRTLCRLVKQGQMLSWDDFDGTQ